MKQRCRVPASSNCVFKIDSHRSKILILNGGDLMVKHQMELIFPLYSNNSNLGQFKFQL
jgi:ApbE superfamily uncharacterized protein (UPF0280 family)